MLDTSNWQSTCMKQEIVCVWVASIVDLRVSWQIGSIYCTVLSVITVF